MKNAISFLLLLFIGANTVFADELKQQYVCKQHISWFTESNVYEKHWSMHRTDNDVIVGPNHQTPSDCEVQLGNASATGLVCVKESTGRVYSDVNLFDLKTGVSDYVSDGWEHCLNTAALGKRYEKVCSDSAYYGRYTIASFAPWRKKDVAQIVIGDFQNADQCREELQKLSALKCVQLRSEINQMQFFGAVRTSDGMLYEKFAGHELATDSERAEVKCQVAIDRYNNWLGTEE